MWNGRPVVPQSWATDSVAPHARISPATTGREGDAFREVYWETDEGYAWHRLEVRSGEHRYPADLANGNGGQLLLVVRSLSSSSCSRPVTTSRACGTGNATTSSGA